MSRWKVEVGFWWVAMQVDEQGREIPDTAKRFPTHAEALAYADKRARTREVVLPRVNDATFIDENNLDLMVVSVDNGIGISQPNFDKPGEDEVIIMYPEFAEEVALALLAHAERMSQ